MNRLRWGLVSAVILLIASWVLLTQIDKVYASSFQWPPLLVTLQFLVLLVCIYLLSMVLWRAFAARAGLQRSLFESLIDTGLVSISKYAPGKIWGIVARGGLKQQTFTLDMENVLVSGLEQGYLLVYGFITGLALLLYPVLQLPLLLYVFILVVFLLLFSAMVAVVVRFARRYYSRLPVLSWSFLVAIGAAYFLLWVLNGAALLVLGQSFASVTADNSATLAAYFILSIAVGWLVIFVPGGIGVREGVFVYLVKDLVSIQDALMLASLHRGMTTLFDLGFGGISLLYTFYRTGNKVAS